MAHAIKPLTIVAESWHGLGEREMPVMQFVAEVMQGWHDYTPAMPYAHVRWAVSARGWLWNGSASSLGNYCDMGADHYRSGHEYCQPDACNCRLSQPGNIHCVVYHGHDNRTHSRYVETVEQAHAWIELESGYAVAELYSDCT